jgi:hypothetical protein
MLTTLAVLISTTLWVLLLITVIIHYQSQLRWECAKTATYKALWQGERDRANNNAKSNS